MELYQVLSLQVTVDLRVIAMKYSTLTRSPELDPYHQMQFSIIPRISLFLDGGVYPFYRGPSQHILNSAHRENRMFLYLHIFQLTFLLCQEKKILISCQVMGQDLESCDFMIFLRVSIDGHQQLNLPLWFSKPLSESKILTFSKKKRKKKFLCNFVWRLKNIKNFARYEWVNKIEKEKSYSWNFLRSQIVDIRHSNHRSKVK